jgi:hypothetical protein
MKRTLLILIVLSLAWTQAQAQEFSINGRFGIRFDLLIPGIHLGLEAGTPEWQIGIRGSANPYLIVNNFTLDVYIRYVFPEGTAFYIGAGRRWITAILSSPSTDWHGLIGVQFPSQFFIEIQPGILSGTSCGPIEQPLPVQNRTPPCGSIKTYETFSFVATVGWSWRF